MQSQENHITVKSAVATAIDYVKDLYEGKNLRDLLLEEVEFSDNHWIITVGFSLPEIKEETASLSSLVIPNKTSRMLSRHYKVVNIDAETGIPISMKIRNP